MAVINTNVKAIVAQDSMRQVNLKLATAMERLSTGLRINSAKDDAAGLAISERMNAQVRGLGMAIKNANDGLSMAQTADGAYGEVTSMLQRMRELAVQAATGSMSKLDRESIQLEIEELKAEIENVATKTHFNNIKLLDGTARNVVLQVGANEGDTIQVGFESVRTKDIGSGLRPALTSVGGRVETFDRFEAGDLLVNGVLVNASLRTDDNQSFAASRETQTITFSDPVGGAVITSAISVTVAGVAVSISATDFGTATTKEAVAEAVAAKLKEDTAFANRTVFAQDGSVTIIFQANEGNVAETTVTGNTATLPSSSIEVATLTNGGGTATEEIAASAIAKAAAINRVTEQSGVYARVNDTTVMGTTMGTAVPVAAAAMIINGVSTAKVALGTDLETNREAIAKAINDISDQTGVRAINTGDDQQGVRLVAADGRNITLNLTEGLTASNTGLGFPGTYVGTYSLYSKSGEAITINHQVGKDISGTGLRMGTYQPDTAAMVTFERSGFGSVDRAGLDGSPVPQPPGVEPSSGTVGVLRGNTLVLNEIIIDAARATDDTASKATTASSKAASAIAIAAAINRKTHLHGVTAKAEPNVIRSETTESFVIGTSGTVNLNGVNIGISTKTRDGVIETINQFSGQTGVVARAYGQGIELVAEDGRNLVIGLSDTLSAGNLGLSGVMINQASGATVSAEDGSVFYASVSLTSDKAFTVARGSEGGPNFEALGFRAGTFGGNDTGVKVAEINVSTQAGASIAITAIDAALEDVMSAQAKSGAYQNRLDAIVNVLSESTENLQASKSRIMDTDYALEATNLAKAQIISQAATAMLAQANQSQQSVLQLLQG